MVLRILGIRQWRDQGRILGLLLTKRSGRHGVERGARSCLLLLLRLMLRLVWLLLVLMRRRCWIKARGQVAGRQIRVMLRLLLRLVLVLAGMLLLVRVLVVETGSSLVVVRAHRGAVLNVA